MATDLKPLIFYVLNNVKLLKSLSEAPLYTDNFISDGKPSFFTVKFQFEELLKQIENEKDDPHFQDLLRLVLGLGFVVVPGKFGILSDPKLLAHRTNLFNSTTTGKGRTKIELSGNISDEDSNAVYNVFNNLKLDGKIYQDANFKVENIEEFAVTVRTIANSLNELDIYKNDLLFTNGELNPNKQETSLKYAYAFETFEAQGTNEVVVKEVKLAGQDSETLIEAANNDNDITVIERLKNIIYDSEESAEIEKIVKQEDAAENIKIEKLYNIVTIQIPKKESEKSVIDYIKTDKSDVNSIDLINYNFNAKKVAGDLNNPSRTPKLNVVSDSAYYFSLITEYAFIRHALDLIGGLDDPFAATSIDDVDLFPYKLPLKIDSFGAGRATILKQFNEELAGKFLSTQNNEDFVEVKKLIKSIENNNSLSTVQTDSQAEFIKKFAKPNEILAGAAFYNLLGGLYNKRQVIRPDSIYATSNGIPKTGPSNYNISEIFQLLLKNKGLPVFNEGQIADSLYRNSRLAGLKIIKSSSPYDKENMESFEQSIIQTYHLPVQEDTTDKTITLFDSQIIYGKEYFYTVVGIYDVDGKYYFYGDRRLKSIEKKTGKKEKKNVDNATIVDGKKIFTNACCRSRAADGKNLYAGQQTPGLTRQQRIDGFFDNPSNKTAITDVEGINSGDGNWLDPIIKQLFMPDQEASIYNTFATPDLVLKNPDQPGVTPTTDANIAKRHELFCFLCRRSGTATPDAPRIDEIISKKLEDNDTFVKQTAISGFPNQLLGGVIDCRRYGFKNRDGGVELISTTKESDSLNRPLLGHASEAALDVTAEANIISVIPQHRCRKQIETDVVINTFDSFEFEVEEFDSKTLVEVPIATVKNSIVGRVPMPPDVTFVPLADTNDQILIRFLEAVQSTDLKQPIDDMLRLLNGSEVIEKLTDQSGSESFVLARSQGDLSSIVLIRSDVKPNSLEQLVGGDNSQRLVIDWKDGEIYSNVLPNKKYWYVFATRDITGLYSAASSIFQVELVEESGFVYAEVGPFEFEIKEEKTTTKTFKKLIKIKPAFDETLPRDAEQVGTKKLFSTIKKGKGESLNAPPKFKIRVRSKKTKRVFDINLKYTQAIKNIYSKKLLKLIKEKADLIDEKIE